MNEIMNETSNLRKDLRYFINLCVFNKINTNKQINKMTDIKNLKIEK